MHRFISKKSWSVGLVAAMSSLSMACAAQEPESAKVAEALGAQGVSSEALWGMTCPTGGSMFAPGEVSLPERSEYRLTFSADGNTAYYHVDSTEAPFQAIYETHKVNGHFTPGQMVSFSGTYLDTDPFLSPDGQSLFFSSTRPITGTEERPDSDLWMVHKQADGSWGAPQHLGPNINSDRMELYVSADRAGNLYFASGTFDSDFNIYRAERRGPGYAPAQKLPIAINSDDYWEYNSHISADGRVLIFASLNRPEGYGLGDLYASINLGGGRWTKAINLGPKINTEKDEFHPSLSVDGRRIYFVRQTWNPFVPSDFYELDTYCLLFQ
ncbi:Xaa-Pro aminopeptidase [Myxococcus stipitatus]|uniref:Xaa-Pro aminopeptidase n=1 Tax=Myxococcus stipitatus TaxID=83455 RepID=UPI0030D559E1